MKKIVSVLMSIVINVVAFAQSSSLIYFESNKAELSKASIHTLDSIKNVLSKTNKAVVEIYGHCDNSGSSENNMKLSERRATSAFNYLNNPSLTITFKAEGANQPIADNASEAGKAKNRRVEIIIRTTSENKKTESVKQIESSKTISKASDSTNTTTSSFSSASKLEDIKVGSTMILQNLNFEGGTALLLKEAKPTLEVLLKTMKENPGLKIEIGGHVCCFDDMPLSVRRAQVVYTYLLKNGIEEERMKYKGYSRNKPIYEDDREEPKAKANRRVEITILAK